MVYLPRLLASVFERHLDAFPVVAITGPRQSGKSTFVRHLLAERYEYVTFDDPLLLEFLDDDPRGFMDRYGDRVVFDEAQKAPELFAYLKMAVDDDRGNYGKYVLTGSSQFNLNTRITESLAGRIGLLSLLPFQFAEIPAADRPHQLVLGSYPELVVRHFEHASDWFRAYLATYIERDVRSLHNVGNLRDFTRLVQLLAAGCGQELNMSRLARDIGVDSKTVQAWISVLEASYVVFLLPSYQRNLGKRLVKRPKLHFYDTGLVCYLTGIEKESLLDRGPLAGPVFENYIVAETKKALLHAGTSHALSYLRTGDGLEVDLVVERSNPPERTFIEIKNSMTVRPRMADPIRKLRQLEPEGETTRGLIIYRGEVSDRFSGGIRYQDYREYLEAAATG